MGCTYPISGVMHGPSRPLLLRKRLSTVLFDSAVQHVKINVSAYVFVQLFCVHVCSHRHHVPGMSDSLYRLYPVIR